MYFWSLGLFSLVKEYIGLVGGDFMLKDKVIRVWGSDLVLIFGFYVYLELYIYKKKEKKREENEKNV